MQKSLIIAQLVCVSVFAVLPAPVTGQLFQLPAQSAQVATESGEDCSDCDTCPTDPEEIAFYDNFQDDVAYLHQGCYPQVETCDLIDCQNGWRSSDIDAVAAAIERKQWKTVEKFIDRSGGIAISLERNAVVISGCDDRSIAAILPLRAGREVALRLTERVKLGAVVHIARLVTVAATDL
jgi:hypothetical protein